MTSKHTSVEMILSGPFLDPPRFDPEDLRAFTEPVTVKVGHNAVFKLSFVGHKPIKIKWYREGEELQDDSTSKIERSDSQSRLLMSRCQRRNTGEVKIKLKNDDGFVEAISQLVVLGERISSCKLHIRRPSYRIITRHVCSRQTHDTSGPHGDNRELGDKH